jgi:hypothetical protein
MYWQWYTLRRAAALTRAATYRIDLPETGMLGSMIIRLSGDEVSGFGQSGGDWKLLDVFTKLEVVANGSLIIKDLTPQLVQALAWYDGQPVSNDVVRNYASNTQFAELLVNFGRFLGDQDYGLDLSAFDNVELRLTNDAGTTEFSDTLAATVLLSFLRPSQQARSLGYMRSEIWRSWTTVQNEWTYLDLPTEALLRRVVVQALPAIASTGAEADTGFANCIYDLQCYLRTGEIEVFNGRASDLMHINALMGKRDLISHMHPYLTADIAVRTDVGYPLAHVFTVGSYSGAVETVIPTLKNGQTADTLVFESGAGAGPDEGLIKGMGYHDTVMLPFDYNLDPATWLDPNLDKQVQFNVHCRDSSSADNAAAKVVLDRLVRR